MFESVAGLARNHRLRASLRFPHRTVSGSLSRQHTNCWHVLLAQDRGARRVEVAVPLLGWNQSGQTTQAGAFVAWWRQAPVVAGKTV